MEPEETDILRLCVVDSHTEGESTRVVINGWPKMCGRTMAERREFLLEHQDHLRTGLVCEPRGHDGMVGAILTDPVNPDSIAGTVFVNDVGALSMCGHGTIGVIKTLQHVGRIAPGTFQIDTPAGSVQATLSKDGSISVVNVPSYCTQQDVSVEVGGACIVGDVAYGGNWFFLTDAIDRVLDLSNIASLMEYATAIRSELARRGIAGADGSPIDHIELFGKAVRRDADARNFVLCPGNAYDRSPCGTGTSAKMAVLFSRGKLALGYEWRQESIVGSLFRGSLRRESELLVPTITGDAHIVGESELYFDASDPFRFGIVADR